MGRSRDVVTDYLRRFRELVDGVDIDRVVAAIDCLRNARDTGRTIFVAGNGGSAATASHLTNDLGKATKQSGQAHVRIMCLTDNTPWLTALANDEGYDRVFSGQLENFAREGDVLVAISASGSSPNLVSAVDMAEERGVAVIGLLGFDGGALRDRVDHLLLVETPRGEYGPVESAHSVIADLLTTALIADRVGAAPFEASDA